MDRPHQPVPIKKHRVIHEALELHQGRLGAYQRGLITPNTLAEALAYIWMDACEKLKQ